METKTKGFIGIVLLLATSGLGTYFVLDNNGQYVAIDETSYLCPLNNITLENAQIYNFDRLSSSGKTGYWTTDSVTKSKLCSVGWIQVSEFAATNNITLSDYAIEQPKDDGADATFPTYKENDANLIFYYAPNGYISVGKNVILDCIVAYNESYCKDELFIKKIPQDFEQVTQLEVPQSFKNELVSGVGR